MVHVLSNVGKGQSNHAPRSTLCKLKWLSFAGAFEIATSIALWRVRFGCHTFCCVTTKRLRLPVLIYDDLKVNSGLKSNSSWTHVNKHVLSTQEVTSNGMCTESPSFTNPSRPAVMYLHTAPVKTGCRTSAASWSVSIKQTVFFHVVWKFYDWRGLLEPLPELPPAWTVFGDDCRHTFTKASIRKVANMLLGHKMNLCMALISIRTHHTARYFSMQYYPN